ncbi:MAG: hypothetical protein H8D67_17210 [Deltaproteobacteria bacterium]|nr:hypothetical protein [Deltaproteobacteria bacterium]
MPNHYSMTEQIKRIIEDAGDYERQAQLEEAWWALCDSQLTCNDLKKLPELASLSLSWSEKVKAGNYEYLLTAVAETIAEQFANDQESHLGKEAVEWLSMLDRDSLKILYKRSPSPMDDKVYRMATVRDVRASRKLLYTEIKKLVEQQDSI